MTMLEHKLTAELIQEAKSNPGGWVYQIDRAYNQDANIPPEGIIGAWKVDNCGKVTGEFRENEKYRRQR